MKLKRGDRVLVLNVGTEHLTGLATVELDHEDRGGIVVRLDGGGVLMLDGEDVL